MNYQDLLGCLKTYHEIAQSIEKLKTQRDFIDAQIAEAEVSLIAQCSADLVALMGGGSVEDLISSQAEEEAKPIPFPLFDVKEALEEEEQKRSRYHYGSGTRPKRYRKGTNEIEAEWRDHTFRTAARALGLPCPMEERNGTKLIYVTADEETQIRDWIRIQYPERYKGGRENG
jgi:hypothetical protein